MELNKGDESGEMYLPDGRGEYVPKLGMQNFSVQGLSDALMSLESEVTMVQPLAEEYALLLEVTMADCPRHPCPPTFSWNAGMLLLILKGDPTLTLSLVQSISISLLQTRNIFLHSITLPEQVLCQTQHSNLLLRAINISHQHHSP